MSSDDTLSQIRGLNAAYLVLIQQLLLRDRSGEMQRLRLPVHIADVIAALTPAQIEKLASVPQMLCSFSFRDTLVLALLAERSEIKARV
ncbi:flagellar transcriptional regulator FlhD [Paraburkholderia sp. J7]|uniref:flagellar transcriptional regulator FlhD n=1 Tax=Paraburkholderia sp. J7 TaxID=2805438 RepID=UPI002AB785CC|nr:flagellar transcriptional regulator FlhD [Paraburkholderia sp. J7]